VIAVKVCNAVMVTIVISVAIMVRNVMCAVRVAALLLHLPRWNIAIAPAGLLAFVPTSRPVLVIITIVIVVAIMVAVGVAVLVVVLVFVATMAVAVSAFRERNGGQSETKHHGQ
jgi:hypothetical protein